MGRYAVWLLVLLGCAVPGWAATIPAASCSQANVQTAMDAATTGDVVTIPAGSCAWSGMTITKAIKLQGAGSSSTLLTVAGMVITKSSAGIMRFTGMQWSNTGGGATNHAITLNGNWQGTQPVVFRDMAFVTSNAGLFVVNVPGGVIFSHVSFTGEWDDSFLQIKDPSDVAGSWVGANSADTMGTRDTGGLSNLYVEDSTFLGGTNQGIDCDDGCRFVNRYNVFTNSESNSHGYDTSAVGMRHFEIYNNQFLNSRDTSQLANENQAIWIRGGTGVIYNNFFDDLAGSWWGDKPEIKMNIRGAEDARPQGTCGQVSYPVPRQLGQNWNGTAYFTDPIYFWGNTGTTAIEANFNWGNPCGFTFSTFFQWGRDAINPSAQGGTAKPGYAAYTYPHPLASEGVTLVEAPKNLRFLVR